MRKDFQLKCHESVCHPPEIPIPKEAKAVYAELQKAVCGWFTQTGRLRSRSGSPVKRRLVAKENCQLIYNQEMRAVAIKKSSREKTAGFQEMGTLRCEGCGEEFFIGHNPQSVDKWVAEKQAKWLEKALA